MSDIRVLFVHEDRGVRDLLSFVSTRKKKLEGISASIVANPLDAKKRLEQFTYDAILSGTRFENDLNAWKRVYREAQIKNTPFGLLTCTDPLDFPVPARIETTKPKDLCRFICDVIDSYNQTNLAQQYSC